MSVRDGGNLIEFIVQSNKLNLTELIRILLHDPIKIGRNNHGKDKVPDCIVMTVYFYAQMGRKGQDYAECDRQD